MSKRVLQGVIVSDACDKTVIVRVERRVMHPVYKKFVTHSKKYAAHDENNSYRTGDVVRIEESRPISKRKSWIVLGGPADAAPGRRPARAAAVSAAGEADAPIPEPRDQEAQDHGPPPGDRETAEPAGGAA
jgi:small subunit ribosomal protein S17